MVRIVRRHWIALLSSLIPVAILAIAPLLVMPLLQAASSLSPALAPLATNSAMLSFFSWSHFTLGLWWLFLWIGAFNAITRYFLNVWILTTKRIVEIRQPRYFNRKVSSFFLNRIQDVTSNVSGIFGTVFGFGSIHVETAGETEAFEMHNIYDPTGFRDIILHEMTVTTAPREAQ